MPVAQGVVPGFIPHFKALQTLTTEEGFRIRLGLDQHPIQTQFTGPRHAGREQLSANPLALMHRVYIQTMQQQATASLGISEASAGSQAASAMICPAASATHSSRCSRSISL